MSQKHFKAGRMRKNALRVMSGFMAGLMAFGTVIQTAPTKVYAADNENGWREENGVNYWYENGVRQGYKTNEDGSIDETYRGKEIYDPDSDAWYWLDNVQQGAVAKNKDVYQESFAGQWGDREGEDGNRYGKWVRYDENGHMVKGWNEKDGNRYYFDLECGTMAKGEAVIDGVSYYFNPDTGILEGAVDDNGNSLFDDGWHSVGGVNYWYEGGTRQGVSYNEDGSVDEQYRGKEIYDPSSNAWYWLDNVQQGAAAKDKDVYQESDAGNWADRTDGTGKWVRYDAAGHMVKGWNSNAAGTYYFDPVYGTMAKGYAVIDGGLHYFDKNTGVEQPAGWDGLNGWVVYDSIDGNAYWYENGVRQGVLYNEDGSIDVSYRGKEIYDPDSDAWYWLDSVDNGKKAVSKDVYQDSLAGDWGDTTNEQGQRTGKWVRYDERGHMVKGWSTNENGTYYFDLVYGTMAKGTVTIDGKKYEFDGVTGILIRRVVDDSQKDDSRDEGDNCVYSDAVVDELTDLKDYRVETGSDNEGELILPYNEITSQLKKDDVLILPANDAWEDGLVLKVTDAYTENGEVRVDGYVPTDPLEVYDSVNISCTASVAGIEVPDDVVYSVVEPDVHRAQNGEIKHPGSSSDDTIDVSGDSLKHTFTIKQLNTKVTVDISKAIVDIEYDKKGIKSFSVKIPSEFVINTKLDKAEKDFKYEFGSIDFKLPAGFSLEVGLYLVADAEGKLSIEYTLKSVIGLTCDDGGIEFSKESTSKCDVVLSGEVKLGTRVQIGIYFAKDILDAWNKFKKVFGSKDEDKNVKPLFDLAAEAGEKIDANLRQHGDMSLNCIDANGYLYMSMFFADDCLLGDMLDKLFEKAFMEIEHELEIIDKDNSPCKISIHLEDKDNAGFEKVDKCTYKPIVLMKNCTIKLSQNEYEWDGTAKEPTVHVYSGDDEIPSSEYVASYADNVNVGNAKVIVTAKDGSKVVAGNDSKKFTIKKASLAGCEITLSQKEFEYDGQAKEPSVTVKSKEGVDIPSKEYTVSYTDNVEAGVAKAIVTANSDSSLVTGSSQRSFKIVEKELPKTELSSCTITLSQSRYMYDGTAKKPTVKVKNGDTVIPSTEYTVSYKNNVDVGTATATVTANSTSKVVTGSTSITFTIMEKIALSSCTITLSQDRYIYDGTAKKPTVTVKYGDTVVPSSEYAISYTDNVKVGTAKVTVTAMRNSKVVMGSATKTFSIVEKEQPKTELSSCTIILSQDSYEYDGTAKKPTVTVKSGSTVIPSTEYTVRYTDNVNVGTATVTVTANSTSKVVAGSATKTFSIVEKQPVEQELDVKVDKRKMNIGDTATITATSSGGSISYTSSDNDVATVSDEGIITAIGEGTATITVTAAKTSEYLEKSVEIEIVVKDDKPKYYGTFGDANWEISNGGKLSVTGSCDGKLYEEISQYGTPVYPWDSYKNEITSAYINVEGVTDLSYLFFADSKLEKVDLSDLDTSQVTNMASMFRGCSNLNSIDVSSFDTGNVTDMSLMFWNCSNLSILDVSSFDTSNVTSMGLMFEGCSNLSTIDVSGFDTGNVTSMWRMFSGCSNLSTLDVSSFDTGNVKSMDGMFSGCSNLNTIDVSSFDTGNVKSMDGMFSDCSNLGNLDVSSFDTGNVTDMGYMFSGCSSLGNLELSSFDTSKVTEMNYMFSGCSSLSTLDLSSFDTSKVRNMYGMFWDCSKLTEITVGSGWDSSKEEENIFYNCGTDHVTVKP